MKKTTLVHSYVAKHWYNFTERVALAILFRRPNGVDLKKIFLTAQKTRNF